MAKGHSRRRLPRKLKELRGTLEKSREPKNPIELAPGKVPPPPRGLTRTEREEWLNLAAAVEAAGCYSECDLPAFRILVKLSAMGHGGGPPSAIVRALQAGLSALRDFGITPASRSRVEAVPDKSDDVDAAFLFGNGPAPSAGQNGAKNEPAGPAPRTLPTTLN